MKKLLKSFIITACLIIIVTKNVFAADILYLLTHNAHEALIIGEITEMDESFINIKVKNQITSSEDLEECNKVKQIKVSKNIRIKNPKEYNLFYRSTNKDDYITKGDYVLASIGREDGEEFEVVNGIYHVDTLDYKTLNVLSKKDDYSNRADAVAIKIFVNSNGRQSDFAFNQSRLYCNNKLVYDASKDLTFINPNSNENGILKENLDLVTNKFVNLKLIAIIIFLVSLIVIFLIIMRVKKIKIKVRKHDGK